MKKTLFTALVLLILQSSWAQPWLTKLPQEKSREELTLQDYKDAFNDYWKPFNVEKGYYYKNGEKIKATGWTQFQRWIYAMDPLVSPTTNKFPTVTGQQVYDEYLKIKQTEIPKSANWTTRGPSSSGGGYAGIGRINCIEFHPTDNNTYWVGIPAGGLWVTTNNGSSWTPLTDFNNVIGISDAVVPPNYGTSKTIYIATGDKNAWDNNSIGVLKSTDGGLSWNETGIAYTINQGRMVYRLLMDPSNDQTIIAATSLGVFKTTNGGATWDTELTNRAFVDLEYIPGNFNALVGSTDNGNIYYSPDAGETWTIALSSTSKRVELAVTAANPNIVYAIGAKSDGGMNGIYKSTNGGESFTLVYDDKNLLGWNTAGNDSGGQGWYDLAITASPTDENIVLIGGVNTWRSTNGATTWSIVNHWTGSGGKPAVHADKHMLRYRSNGDLFETNDGGIYISSNNGTSWTDKTNGMEISQIYKLSVANNDPSEVITGLQDNGTKLNRNNGWTDVRGGDGMECLIDYTNAAVQYNTIYYGKIQRTMNRWSYYVDVTPSEAGEGAWVTPYIIDLNDPNTLYAGYTNVWKTTNRGTSWTKISTMNTSNLLRSMAISPSNSQVIYVADETTLWTTTNGGTSWSIISSSLPTGSAKITYIAVDKNDPYTAWVTLGGYNINGVFQTTNGGLTWFNISDGLPEIPMYTIVQNKQIAENHLYVGSEVGIYFKKGTDDWVLYNTNLPNVRIGEIEIAYKDNPHNSKLIAATYGRGLWESPIYINLDPMTYQSATSTQTDTTGVRPGESDIMILGMEIVTDGSVDPLSLSKLSISMEGTTNITDVSSVKVYSTGTNPFFDATTQYGSTKTPANGTIAFDQIDELISGVNYYWLAYTLSNGATVENRINAKFVSIVVNGETLTPSITNPGSGRPILGDPEIQISMESMSFGDVMEGTSSGIKTYTAGGTYLNGAMSIAAPSGFKISKNAESGFTNFLTINHDNGSIEQTIYVKFMPTEVREYSGNVNHTSTGATITRMAVTGTGTEFSGVGEEFKLENITVYPNPSTGHFNVNNPTQRDIQVTITDFKGRSREVKNLGANSDLSVDLSNYPTGIYFIQFIVDNRTHYIRLVKQ